ncbi:MAG: TIGR02206 family membrane protein [Spirochaetales bacterium]
MGHRWFLGVGLAGLLALALGFSVALGTPEGVRLANPAAGETVGFGIDLAGDAWFAPGPQALAKVTVTASAPGTEVSAEMQRIVVHGGGSALPLARWKGHLEVFAAGEWTLVAEATSTGGQTLRTAPRQVTVNAGAEAGAFRSFSPQHLFPLLAVLVLVVASFVSVTKRSALPRRMAWTLAILLWGNEIVYQSVWFLQGGWSVYGSLMVQLCGLSILVLPFALLMPEGRWRRRLVEVVWFWGTGGALIALLTPDLGAAGFPTLRYVSFFLSHGLILVSVAALAAERKQAITLGALGRVLLVTNVLLVPIALLNAALVWLPPHDPGNYFVLSFPPPEGSPVDLLARVFGPSPGYIVGFELLAAAVFTLFWLPFALARRWHHRTEPGKERPLRSGADFVAAQFGVLGVAVVWPWAAREFPGHLVWGPAWSGWELVAALVLAALSGALAAWSVLTLGKNLTALPQPLATSQLVQSGPYRVLRHPIYTALIGLLTAWTLLWKDPVLLALTLALIVVFLFKSRLEERWLAARYPDYGAYRERTGGLFPRIF